MFLNNKKEGEGRLINWKGEIYEGYWQNDKRNSRKPVRKISMSKYDELISTFMKTKSILEPQVKIIL